MRKTIAVLMSAGMLAAPAGALAAPIVGHHHARTVARQQCTAERSLLGVKAFRLKYGATKAYVNCVKSHLPTNRQAATACRTERKALGAKAFRLKYGGPSALNRCIKEQTTP